MSPGDSNERAKYTHLKLSLVENGIDCVWVGVLVRGGSGDDARCYSAGYSDAASGKRKKGAWIGSATAACLSHWWPQPQTTCLGTERGEAIPPPYSAPPAPGRRSVAGPVGLTRLTRGIASSGGYPLALWIRVEARLRGRGPVLGLAAPVDIFNLLAGDPMGVSDNGQHLGGPRTGHQVSLPGALL